MSKPKNIIAVSGFAGTSVAEPGGAVASALRKAFNHQIKIIALAYSSWTNAAFMTGLVDEIYLIAPLTSVDAHYRELLRVFNICHPDIYIPALELEVKYLHYCQHQFRDSGPKSLIPDASAFERVSKLGLHYFCNDHGFLYPKTILVNHVIEFNYMIHRTTFPCLIKSILCGATFVNSVEEATAAAKRLSNGWSQPVLIQDYIPGDQYMVAALFDERGKMIKILSARKHLLDYFGKSAITLLVDQKELNKTALRILKKLDWKGPLELEFIKTADGRYYLFEVNPRFPSWIDIASSKDNNLPAVLVGHLQGQTLKTSARNNAHDILLRDTDEVCVPMHRFTQLQKTGNLQFINGVHHDALKKSPRISSTIAITGVSAHHIPMPGLSLAKAIKQVGAPFHLACFAENYYDTGCYREDLFDHIILMKFSLHQKELLKKIRSLRRKINLCAIIPTLDRHIEIFIHLEKELMALGIHLLLPTLDSLKQVYHFPFETWAHASLTIPNSILIEHIRDIPVIIQKIGYPAVLKKIGPDKSCIKIVYSREELESDYRALPSQHPKSIYFLQQFVEGEHFAVFGFAAKQGALTNVIVIKVVQSCAYGKTWMATHMSDAVAAPFSALLQSIVHHLQWRGPIEIDCIRDRYHEKIYCIDINPRFPSWVFYTSIVQPQLLQNYLQLLTGNSMQHTLKKEKTDHVYIRLPKNFYSNMSTLGKLISGKGLRYHE